VVVATNQTGSKPWKTTNPADGGRTVGVIALRWLPTRPGCGCSLRRPGRHDPVRRRPHPVICQPRGLAVPGVAGRRAPHRAACRQAGRRRAARRLVHAQTAPQIRHPRLPRQPVTYAPCRCCSATRRLPPPSGTPQSTTTRYAPRRRLPSAINPDGSVVRLRRRLISRVSRMQLLVQLSEAATCTTPPPRIQECLSR
jgi:hypothetical protein